MRQIAFLAAVAASVVGICVGMAGAEPAPIGPHQSFNGLVNGSSGSAVIRMACFGPIIPGETGHPFAGQTIAVTRFEAGAGFTGEANIIRAAVFTSSSTTSSPIPLAAFRYYDQPAAISTELSFPCAGTGSVVFKPVFAGPKPRNGGPNARSAVVRVYFEGQP